MVGLYSNWISVQLLEQFEQSRDIAISDRFGWPHENRPLDSFRYGNVGSCFEPVAVDMVLHTLPKDFR